MIKDGEQVIIHNQKEYMLMHASYRWIMHKWGFLIQGHDSPIYSGEKITFLNSEMTVCFTERQEKTETCGKHETETFIEAWIL